MTTQKHPGPIKVLHVISGLTIGGAEMMLYKLLRETDPSRVAPAVLSLSSGGPLATDITDLGIPLWEIPMPGGMPRRGFRPAFREVLARVQPDVVASWMYRANAVCSALVPEPTPLVWHIRQSLDHNSSQRLLFRFTRQVNRAITQPWGRLLGRSPDMALYNSYASRDQHRRAGYRASRDGVIPNGFDLDLFRPQEDLRRLARQRWGFGDDELLFGIVGRYHPIKNHIGFVRAAGHVRQERKTARFVMIGRGLDRENRILLKEIAARGLEDSVLLLGEQRNLPEVYNGLDILVSASLVEAFPNVLGEGMACGRPCIATAVGDSSRVLGDTGLTVAAGDSRLLGEAMLEAARWPLQERTRRSVAARARVEDHFSIPSVARAFQEAYEGVLPEGPFGG
ncbi:Glycosyltransferase involved in cell wall bisynthesis [Alkalispirochaeta americana]|uniref:Glycosyltransferase involved in cell wall bisynthesis n=1 Tax=Alkalispirochaeta americana TaxID=159291 RepID=A0A1N6XSZ3_9SPIO|nr:glycosyltransferase [Alkalispirochaeta americana]SIR05349.1 Glycosyltransferase involved in cell wall bisynthesis [Alkalispirochaeta americana]